MTKKLITISIPVYNEEENIERLLIRIVELAKELPHYDFEFLFTDNASTDNTFDLLKTFATKDIRIRVLRFSRNFGFQRSILTNYLNARGDAVVQIDADMQDPPELIKEFIKYWEQGYKVVYGIRKKRKENIIMEFIRKIYYRTLSALSEVDIPNDVGDFRLVDRSIVELLKGVNDYNPYLRGIISGYGFKQIGISFTREERAFGSSKFNIFSLIKLGIDGFCSQSTKPLHFITLSGLFICFLTFLMSIYYLLLFIFFRSNLPEGFTTLTLLQLFSLGLNALFIGIIGEYVGRIFNNTQNHPISLIEYKIENGFIYMMPEDILIKDN